MSYRRFCSFLTQNTSKNDCEYISSRLLFGTFWLYHCDPCSKSFIKICRFRFVHFLCMKIIFFCEIILSCFFFSNKRVLYILTSILWFHYKRCSPWWAYPNRYPPWHSARCRCSVRLRSSALGLPGLKLAFSNQYISWSSYFFAPNHIRILAIFFNFLPI